MQYLKKEVEDRIYEVARMEFLLHGYTATTMRKIAKEAGITATNIYRYFENKEELYEKIVLPVYNMVTDLFRMNTHSTLSAVEVGDTLLKMMPTLLYRFRDELIILIDGSRGTKYENAKEEIIAELASDVARHIGLYNQQMQHEVFHLALARPLAVSFLEGILDIIRNSRDSQAIMELTAQLIQLYFFWSVQPSAIKEQE